MSRRKQAKPRLWKREEEAEEEEEEEEKEEEEDDENEDEAELGKFNLNTSHENNSFEDVKKVVQIQLERELPFELVSVNLRAYGSAEEESVDENDFKEEKCTDENLAPSYSRECLSRNSDGSKDEDQGEHFLLDDDNSFDSDTLGTEGGSSWVSEDHITSPGSSCATPNSTTEAPDLELSFTVGITDDTPHLCRFCDKAFPKQSYLKKHEQTHAEYMPFRCEFCKRLFKHKRSRDRHIKLHTGDRKYKCMQCDAAFSRSDHLKIHMKTHDHHKPFQCTYCNRGYNTAAALTSHMQNHKRSTDSANHSSAPPGTTFKCLQCSEIFRKPDELQNHMNSHQAIDNLSPNSSNNRLKSSTLSQMRLTCSYCTKDNFCTMEALQCHLQSVHKSIVNGSAQFESNKKSDSPPPVPTVTSAPRTLTPSTPLNSTDSFLPVPAYFCELCNMRFSSSHLLQKHMTAMHGSFSSMKYLMMPELVNNGKLYCMYCAMHFLTPASFAEHYVIFHSSYHQHLLGLTPPATEQIKPTDLSVARKASPVKRSIEDEQMSPKKKFKTNENLNPNLIAISNAQYDYTGPLICNQCFAAFTNFDSFRAHIRLHMEETSGGLLGGATPTEHKRIPVEYTCPHCQSVFASVDEIGQHVITHFVNASISYNCENCHKPFDKLEELHKHLMDVHAQHLYSCSICNEVFDSKVTIQVHFASRHSNEAKVFRCTGCPASNNIYHSELEFANHVKTFHANNSFSLTMFNDHHNSQAVKCMICLMSFSSELDMQLHLATHGKQFQCTLCPQSFHIEYLLDKHMQIHHSPSMNGNQDPPDNGVKDLSPRQSPGSRFGSPVKKTENSDSKGNFICCDICEKSDFSSELDLIAHKKLHHKLPSPTKLKDPNENNNDPKQAQKLKLTSSASSSPTLRFDASKKVDNSGEIHSNNNVTSCEICEKRDFINEAELQSHKKLIHHVKLTSTGKVSLQCAYCNENCKSRSDLENHMKTHSQNCGSTGKHKCIICDEMCPTAAVLAEHKLTHCKVLSGKTCMHCKGAITNEEQFYSHIQQHSSANGNNVTNKNHVNTSSQLILPTVCVICRQTLVSDMEARMHARFHLHQSADLVSCSVCFQTSERQDLVAGICRECYQRHEKTSPFRCPECHIKFDSGTAIEIHMATAHRKSYQCNKCQASFDNEKDIQHHVNTHLMMDGLSVRECRLCHVVMASQNQLQAHLIEHTFAGCAAYTCYLCSSVFTTAQGLQTHILNHGISSRPYDCSRCNQKFFFTSELEHHNYLHLEEIAISEGQYFNQDKSVKEKSPYTSSLTLSDNGFSSKSNSKYSCTECNIDFTHGNDYLEHRTYYHNLSDRFVNKADHKHRPEFNEKSDTNEKIALSKKSQNGNLPSIEIKVECKSQEGESDEEQIDVVTTKTEGVEVDDTNEID